MYVTCCRIRETLPPVLIDGRLNGGVYMGALHLVPYVRQFNVAVVIFHKEIDHMEQSEESSLEQSYESFETSHFANTQR